MASACASSFEVEEVTAEELAALDAALQAASSQPRQTKPQAVARMPALLVRCVRLRPPCCVRFAVTPRPQGGAKNVTLEVVSLTHFALRVPPELKQPTDGALAGLRSHFEPVACAADGVVELHAPLAAYDAVVSALNSARLLRAPARGEHETFDCGGRVPLATLTALRAAARRLQPGEPEHAEQARALHRCARRRSLPPRCAALAFKLGRQLTAPAQEAREAQELQRYDNIPQPLRATLLPFQQEGVRIGLRRGGRLLLADDVGTGKTLQALALATAYADNGPVLIICPASLRLMWAEQVERWWPGLTPSACTVVLSSKDSVKLDDLPRRHASTPAASRAPRVVIISYHMLQRLDPTIKFASIETGCVVVDEAHTMSTTNGDEPQQTQAAAKVVKEAAHAILLSGTPALNRPFDLFCQANALSPGLLGAAKEDFARAYCERRRRLHGSFNNSGGTRLRELHLLLSNTIMLRREKKDVAGEVPPIRRLVVRLHLSTFNSNPVEGWDKLSPLHQLGWRKADAVCEWLKDTLLQKNSTNKVVVFAYHMDVMAYIQQVVMEGHLAINEDGTAADLINLPYVTIRGTDSAVERQLAVDKFKRDTHVRAALLSIEAANSGLDFSSADSVVFAELPEKSSHVPQAEARVHRRGAAGDAEGASSRGARMFTLSNTNTPNTNALATTLTDSSGLRRQNQRLFPMRPWHERRIALGVAFCGCLQMPRGARRSRLRRADSGWRDGRWA